VSAGWYRYDRATGTLSLTLHVQPNASRSAFAGMHGDALRVRVAAPAVDNKANAALLDFLRRELALPAGVLSIRHGAQGRRKVVIIAHASPALRARLDALAAD
jgi:Uncharacterized conserved protein